MAAERVFPCPKADCGSILQSKKTARRHIKAKHSSEDGTLDPTVRWPAWVTPTVKLTRGSGLYRCIIPDCPFGNGDKGFTRKGGLRDHYDLHVNKARRANPASDFFIADPMVGYDSRVARQTRRKPMTKRCVCVLIEVCIASSYVVHVAVQRSLWMDLYSAQLAHPRCHPPIANARGKRRTTS